MTSVSAGVWADHPLAHASCSICRTSSCNEVDKRRGFSAFDLIDHVDAEVQVQRFVTKNVLVLLGDANHLIAPAEGQNLARNQWRITFPPKRRRE